MPIRLPTILGLFAGLVACAGWLAADSLAQSYPVKPIRMVVGFSPGGAADVTARLVGQKLSDEMGKPVIVENRAGGSGLVAAVAFINAGRVRALGITGTKRSALIPSTPTISEAGVPGYDSSAWYGILAPAGVPRPIITQLNTLIVKGGQSKQLQEAYNRQGLEPQTHTPEQFGEFIRAEVAKYTELVKRAGILPESGKVNLISLVPS